MRVKLLVLSLIICISKFAYAKSPIILMTDFGLQDGAVSAMKGVILNLDQSLIITDLTHNIEPFNIEEASYRLQQVMEYYPKESIFVCVIDPGVGTKRKSIVAKLKNGYFFVGPDNGILTHVAKSYGVESVRQIDEKAHRLHHHNSSFETFHGRDIFAFTGAKLASGSISFEQVGPVIEEEFVTFTISDPKIENGNAIGNIFILDSIYGNLWTNVNLDLAKDAGLNIGKSVMLEIYRDEHLIYSSKLPFVQSFGEVKINRPLLYINSVGNLAIALNQGNFAKKYHIKAGDSIKLKLY